MKPCNDTAACMRHWGIKCAVWLGCALTLTHCKGEFTGPYPCQTGFDSCVNPGSNTCETDIMSDAANCGQCAKTCDVGALCNQGQCESSPQKLANLSGSASTAPLMIAQGAYVYFSASGDNQVYRVPVTGGTATSAASNVWSCGSTVPFTVDAQDLYYLSNGFATDCGGGSSCNQSGIVKTTTNNLSATLGWPTTSNNLCPVALGVNQSGLYWLSNQNKSVSLFYVPLTGTSVDSIATLDDNNSNSMLFVDNKQALFATSNNSSMVLRQVSVPDGKVSDLSTSIGNQQLGFSNFVVDQSYVYIGNSGCPCGDNNSNDLLPVGQIARFARDGSGGQLIANFTGTLSAMAVDTDYVYWSTDTTVWKVATAGGDSVRVAGNLAAGTTPDMCQMGNCSIQTTQYTAIALDDTSVYIADLRSNVNAIFKVQK